MVDRDGDRPWWASEGGPRDRAEPGPWTRAGAGGDGPRRPWPPPGDEPWPPPRDEPPPSARDEPGRGPGGGRDWVGDATALFGQVAREAARRAGDAQAARPGSMDEAAATHRIDTCGVCPLCSLIRVVAEARPEVVEHVAEATRHLTLALKAVVDAQAAPFADRGYEHIDVD